MNSLRQAAILVCLGLHLSGAAASIIEVSGSFVSVGGDHAGGFYRAQDALDSALADGEGAGESVVQRTGFYPTVNNPPIVTQTRFLLSRYDVAAALISPAQMVNRFGLIDPDGDPIRFDLAANVGSLVRHGERTVTGSIGPNQVTVWFAPAGIYTSNLVVTVQPGDGLDPALVQCGFYRTLAPIILSNPEGGLFSRGQPFDLNVVAIGLDPLSYRWTRDTTDLTGKIEATLGFSTLAVADSGSYQVTVSNAFGAVISESADLQIIVPPALLEMPEILPDGVRLQFGNFDGTPLSAGDIGVYRIFGSVNLVDWVELNDSALTVNNGRLELVIPTDSPARFFKITTER